MATCNQGVLYSEVELRALIFPPAASSELPQLLLFTAAPTLISILFHFIPTSVCMALNKTSEDASLASSHLICVTNSCFLCWSAATWPTLLNFCCKMMEMVYVFRVQTCVKRLKLFSTTIKGHMSQCRWDWYGCFVSKNTFQWFLEPLFC